MKRNRIILISSALVLTACGNRITSTKSEALGISSTEPESSTSSVIKNQSGSAISSIVSSSSEVIESSTTSSISSKENSSSNSPISSDNSIFTISVSTTTINGYEQSSNLIKITKAGTYSLKGVLNGMIVVEAADTDEVAIELNGVNIECDYNSPILVKSADKVKIKAQKGTSNLIKDNRSLKTEENDLDETLGNGAIYAKCDLNISGKGSLKVYSTYNNGIHTTKDLTLKMTEYEGSSLYVESPNNSLKGNDSVTILSGNTTAISTMGDGIKTEDSDISSKGNQRGTVTITGGTTNIYSCCDGIDASYDVKIEDGIDEDTGEKTTPTLNIFTSNYSSYSKDAIKPATATMYLRTTTRNSSTSRYSVLFKDASGNTEWQDATFDKSQAGGRGTTYYFYKLSKPSSVASMMIYKFNSSSENSTSNYLAVSRDWSSINSSYDTLTFSESGTQISNGNWTSYTSSGGGFGGPGGMQEGNDDKAEYSAKGIKSDNEITVNSGNINIKAYDDGLHAKFGNVLENGSSGKGDVTINGGNLSIYASDDGLHADRYMNINGGDLNITHAYEGIEGNVITFKGGNTLIYSTDDGINGANKANMTPLIDFQNGVLDITVYGNDVDGIDSNGSYQQSGGIVISRGYGTSRMSTGLDCDLGATINGGTMVLFGAPEKTPTLGSGVASQTLSGTYGEGTWKFINGTTTFSTTNKYSHSGVYIYSSLGTGWSVTKA